MNYIDCKNKKRGIEIVGKFISFFLFCNLFTIVPSIAKLLWPYLLDLSSRLGNIKVWMFALTLTGANVLSMFVNNLFLWYVYKSNKQFFE